MPRCQAIVPGIPNPNLTQKLKFSTIELAPNKLRLLRKFREIENWESALPGLEALGFFMDGQPQLKQPIEFFKSVCQRLSLTCLVLGKQLSVTNVEDPKQLSAAQISDMDVTRLIEAEKTKAGPGTNLMAAGWRPQKALGSDVLTAVCQADD